LSGRIGKIATRVVGEQYDGDDLDTKALSEGDTVDDGLQAQERKEVAAEVGVVKTVRPRLVRAGPRERQDDEEADEDEDE